MVPKNIHTLPKGHWEFQGGGGGGSKAKIFKGMYEPKLEFSEGWGLKAKKPSVGGARGDFPIKMTGVLIRKFEKNP